MIKVTILAGDTTVVMAPETKSIRQILVADRCTISITAKSDNAAEAVVTGSALVVTSALKREDLETIAKYRPKALRLYETTEDNKKDLAFAIMLGRGTGELDKNGAVYGETVNAEGKAQITIILDDVDKDVVKDDFGPALLKLAKLESALGAAMDEIAAEKASIEEHIQFN